MLEKGVRRVKAINSAAQPIAGVAQSMQVGPFVGKTNLSVVVMDDFKLIFGLEFLRDTCSAVLPHVDSLMMLRAKPCIIPTLADQTREKNLSAMQFEKGCKQMDQEIELVPGTKPPARAPHQISQLELVELKKQLNDMLESGMIKPAKSSYGATILFQKKADGSLCMCCDYQALNKITVKNKYPMKGSSEPSQE
ncbi:UNVERIFIED_CONTAM: hypothetical protein Slati_2752800 [Sesamum latifolium]|uniref:Uncharacterized protein n=1 Tax=Sesamum latifolium TaxID=2727402 RepID=A0AAW2VXD5_9LAMI